MGQRETATQIMKLSEARQQFSPLVNAVFRGETRVIVEKNGIPVAAIVSASDLDRLNQLEEERQRDFGIVDELREVFRGLPEDEVEREFTKMLAAARKRQRAAKQRGGKALT